MGKKEMHMVAFGLMAIGGINWGLVGLLDLNLVSAVVGAWPMLERLVYILVGLSSVYVLATHMKDCKMCSKR